MTDRRTNTVTQRAETPFGTMHVHFSYATREDGGVIPAGGSIRHPGKNPDSTVHQLIEALSQAMNDCLSFSGDEV